MKEEVGKSTNVCREGRDLESATTPTPMKILIVHKHDESLLI